MQIKNIIKDYIPNSKTLLTIKLNNNNLKLSNYERT